jgi:hypothetical protein
MCLWWGVAYESYYLLVCSVKWLDICFVFVFCSPNRECVDEMWVDV